MVLGKQQWWQVTDLAAFGWTFLTALALDGSQLVGLGAIWRTVSGAPVAVGAGVLVYTLLSTLALRVLYRNLIATRQVDTRYAQLSAS